MTYYLLDPDARLDYGFDFSAWLAEGETIDAQDVTVTDGVEIDGTPSEADGIVTVWLHNGTAGALATVTCHITTSAGRQDDRSLRVRVQQR